MYEKLPEDFDMTPLKTGVLSLCAIALGSILMTVPPAWAGDIVLSVEEPAANNAYSQGNRIKTH